MTDVAPPVCIKPNPYSFTPALGRIFQKAGVAVFKQWDDTSYSKLEAIDWDHPARIVASQIIDALASCLIRATVAISFARPISPEVILTGDDSWWEGPYFLSPFYCIRHGSELVDWKRLSISARAVYVGAYRPEGEFVAFDELYSDLSSETFFENAAKFIEDPTNAIKSVYASVCLPSEYAVRRYHDFKNRLYDELAIVAWRLIVMEGVKDVAGYHTKMVEAMHEYQTALDTSIQQKVVASDRTITNFATKIIDQWKTKNKLEYALINSTPKKVKLSAR